MAEHWERKRQADHPGFTVSGSVVKDLPAKAGDMGSIPGSEKFLEERNGNSLQYSCGGNPVDRGAWRATVHGVTKELEMTD